MNFFESFLQERNGMINFNFDFYEIVVWVATIVMCLIAVAARSLPLKARGGLGQPLPNPIAVLLHDAPQHRDQGLPEAPAHLRW